MRLGFAQSDAHAQDGALAVQANPHGRQDSAINNMSSLADFLIAGVQINIGAGMEGPVAPEFQLGVELLSALADRGRADRNAAKFLDDGRDFAGGDALDIHFGQGQFESPLAAQALFQGGRVEPDAAPDLGDGEGDGIQPSGDGFWFEALGMGQAGVDALIRLGLNNLTALLAHGLVDQETDAFGQAIGSLLSDELQNSVQEIRIGLVGHVDGCWMFVRHPNRQPIWAALDKFNRGAAPFGALKKEEKQFTETVLHQLLWCFLCHARQVSVLTFDSFLADNA